MYLPERDVLIPLLNSEYYKTYFEYLDLNYIKENHRELHYVYLALKSLHEEFPDTDHSLKSLQAYFFTKYPDCDKEIYTALFENLAEVELDPEIGSSILKQIKRRQQALKLSESAVQFATGYSSLDKVKELATFLDEEVTNDDVIPDGSLELESILNAAILNRGLRWRLNCLNKSLGSLRDGDFGFIFKRPESGGTALLASEVGYMLDQATRPIIWINNEEADPKVKIRIFLSYFGITLEQLIANKEKYANEFRERVGGKFKFYGIDFSNKKSIEDIVAKYKPQLMLYDQLDKVLGFSNERDDLRLGSIYQWARELCKKGHAGIGVTQADGSAEGVKWLNMGHVANAKTSKQAEADWILGMGMVNAEGSDYVRYLSICKNKLLGDSDTMPDLRHGRFEVLIEPSIMQFKDIINYD